LVGVVVPSLQVVIEEAGELNCGLSCGENESLEDEDDAVEYDGALCSGVVGGSMIGDEVDAGGFSFISKSERSFLDLLRKPLETHFSQQ
jgi:hypothetical protein